MWLTERRLQHVEPSGAWNRYAGSCCLLSESSWAPATYRTSTRRWCRIFLERYLQHSRSFIDTSCSFSIRNGFFKRSFELLFSGKALAYGWELAKHFF